MYTHFVNGLLSNLPENIIANAEGTASTVSNVTLIATAAIAQLSSIQIGTASCLITGVVVWRYQKYIDENNVLALAAPMMRDDMDRRSKEFILNAIRKIPAADRGNVIAEAAPKMRDNMSGHQKAMILDCVFKVLNATRKIPATERDNVLAFAAPMMRYGINGNNKAKLLDAIRKIPATERGDVMARAAPMMRDDMNGSGKSKILDAIRNIPATERDDVMARAAPMMRDDMSGISKAMILGAIRNIPATERDSVIERAAPMMRDDTAGYKKAMILDVIQCIPAEEQNGVLALGASMLRYNGHSTPYILDGIRRIPLEDRAERVARALDQLNIDFPDEVLEGEVNIAHILGSLKIPWYLMCIILMRSFKDLYLDIDLDDDEIINVRVINVHAENRDARVAQSLQLLRQSQNMNFQEIKLASTSCVTYLEKNGCLQALKVLKGPEDSRDYGPFFKKIILNGTQTSGQEVIGRLWQFIHTLSGQDRLNALNSLVVALNECLNQDDERICGQGKIQQLFVAILQGRLQGVNVDEIKSPSIVEENPAAPQLVSVENAINQFFMVPENRNIVQLTALMQAAEAFFILNPLVDHDQFMEEIREYAIQEKIN